LVLTPVTPLAYIIGSGIIAIAIGDTVYIRSLSFLDVSRAYPIAQSTFPILTMIVAVLFLGEPFTWFTGVGAFLVVLGVYLIATSGRLSPIPAEKGKISWKGVALALTAAVAWTMGAVCLKLGVTDMDAFVAAAIRIPVSAVILTLFSLSQNRKRTFRLRHYGLRNMLLAAGTGILTYGVASVCYVTAMQLIGAGKTVLLTAVAPLFILPSSIFILKEKPTRCAIAGTLICVAGVCLVSI
jgi:transporter family protein